MSEIRVTDWTIPGSDGQPVYGNTHRPGGDEVIGVFICCHGFKGYKDYGFIPALCQHAASQGLIAVRFNFSHSGITRKIETFEKPNLFERDRWGRQIEDLREVFDDAASLLALPRVVFGHSRGGVTSLLFASHHQPSSLAGLITTAAPDYACGLDDLAKDELRREGRLLSPSGRTGQKLYVGREWLDEIERDPEWYDPVLAAAHLQCPTLMIHGDADETVPITCAHRLHEAATSNSTLSIVEGANHVFNAANPTPADTPLEQLPLATQHLIQESVAFAVRSCSEAIGR
jgi:pimeloyl-ACP methyl ester carboxylesterase